MNNYPELTIQDDLSIDWDTCTTVEAEMYLISTIKKQIDLLLGINKTTDYKLKKGIYTNDFYTLITGIKKEGDNEYLLNVQYLNDDDIPKKRTVHITNAGQCETRDTESLKHISDYLQKEINNLKK